MFLESILEGSIFVFVRLLKFKSPEPEIWLELGSFYSDPCNDLTTNCFKLIMVPKDQRECDLKEEAFILSCENGLEPNKNMYV